MAKSSKPNDTQADRYLTAGPPPTPRRTRTCHHCAYSFLDKSRVLSDLAAGWPTPLTCFNTPHHPGQIWPVLPTGTCRNFRFQRQPPVRLEPPEPPHDDIRYIALTQGKFAIVDAANYEWLNQYKWTASRVGATWYARRQSKGVTIFMHREIMQPPRHIVVDHIDHNGLHNRLTNMRLCTRRQNNYNSRTASGSSSYKGVSYDIAARKWRATINHQGRHYHLGLFESEIQAARAYDKKAKELFGPYAYLNFPNDT